MKTMRMLASGLLMIGSVSCDDGAHASKVSTTGEVEGELFLNGADEMRIPFKASEADSTKIIGILKSLERARDLKAQGLAVFSYLEDGKKHDVDVTASRLIRIDGKAFGLRDDELLRILKGYWKSPDS